jgi:hypothetical protein
LVQLDSVLKALGTFVQTVRTQLSTLAAYFGGPNPQWESWLHGVQTQLAQAGEAGGVAQSAGDYLSSMLGGPNSPDVSKALQALDVLASLTDHLKSLSPPQALQRLIDVASSVSLLDAQQALRPAMWHDLATRATTLDSAMTALSSGKNQGLRNALNAANSPTMVLGHAWGSVKAAAEHLLSVNTQALALLDSVLLNAPRLPVADLPIPQGQSRAMLGSGSPNATFSLRTIREGRRPGDHILVSITFFRGDQSLPDQVRDEFRIVSYGWNASFVASLAWIDRERSGSKFVPSAAMSWMASHRCWPSGGDPGLGGDPIVGFGLTTMTLKFDTSQAVELGLAPTIGFFDNHVLIGGGASLQATQNRLFAFFAIRLFGAYGGIGSASTGHQ